MRGINKMAKQVFPHKTKFTIKSFSQDELTQAHLKQYDQFWLKFIPFYILHHVLEYYLKSSLTY